MPLFTELFIQVLDQEEEVALDEFSKLEQRLTQKQKQKQRDSP